MDLQKIRDRIEREAKFGDIEAACASVGLKSGLYRVAKKKNSFDDLTAAETKIYLALLDILNKRIEAKELIYNAAVPCTA